MFACKSINLLYISILEESDIDLIPFRQFDSHDADVIGYFLSRSFDTEQVDSIFRFIREPERSAESLALRCRIEWIR